MPTLCGCLASRAGASPFGEQSMSACPRQSRAQARRAMMWQSPRRARSISHGWTSSPPPLVPAAHSASQLRQGHDVHLWPLSFQCSLPELDNLQRYNKYRGKKKPNQKTTNKPIHIRSHLFKVRNRNKGHDISCMNLMHFNWQRLMTKTNMKCTRNYT